MEDEKNNTKTLTTEATYTDVQFINIETHPGWLELPLTETNFHGPKSVRATEVLMYLLLLRGSRSDQNAPFRMQNVF